MFLLCIFSMPYYQRKWILMQCFKIFSLKWLALEFLFFFLLFSLLDIKSWTSHMLDKHFTTVLCWKPVSFEWKHIQFHLKLTYFQSFILLSREVYIVSIIILVFSLYFYSIIQLHHFTSSFSSFQTLPYRSP